MKKTLREALERLRAQISEAADGGQDPLLSAYLSDAEQYILACTYRDALPAELEGAWIRLALVLYNRRGAEGERSHAEGGVRRDIGADDVPASVRDQLSAWRLLPGAARERRAKR